MTSRPRLASTPVMLCGYRNSASAEPNASVTYCHWFASFNSVALVLANLVCAAPNTWLQPPSLYGMYRMATMITR